MIRSIRQLEAVHGCWDALASRSRSPLLTYDWMVSCAEAFHDESDLRILTVRSNGNLVGVAPLVRDRSGETVRLRQLGASRLYEPADWLFETPAVASELADLALAMGEPMILQRLPAPSEVVRQLSARAWRQALVVARPGSSSLAVATQGAWEEYYAGLSSQITTNLRRVRKKAEAAIGAMRVERITPAPAEVECLLESLIAVERSGWKGRLGSDLGSRSDLRDFFRRYGRRAAFSGSLQVARLWFGSTLAAAELSVDAYGRMWQLKIGYNDALRRYYPGLHLTASSLRSAFDRGLEAYEFLGSSAPWEERWRPRVKPLQTVAVYPITAAGLSGAGADLLAVAGRRMRERGRALWRTGRSESGAATASRRSA